MPATVGKVVIVWGPPCCGKNTYVDEHWKDGDLLIDYDHFHSALTRKPLHHYTESAHWPTHQAVEAAIADVEKRKTNGTAWILATSPARAQTIHHRLQGSQIVLIDPGKDVCDERAATRPDPTATLQTIERWYSQSSKPQSPGAYGAKRPCPHPGCKQLVLKGSCPLHRSIAEHSRGSASSRGYDRAWQAFRAAYIADVVQDDPFCMDCRGPFGRESDIELHHEQKIATHPELRFEHSNIMHLCHPCHSARSRRGE